MPSDDSLAESTDLHPEAAVQQDILELQVEVDHIAPVGVAAHKTEQQSTGEHCQQAQPG